MTHKRAVLGIAIILATSGAMLGFTASFLVPRKFVARAKLAFVQPLESDARQLFLTASQDTFSRESLTPLILQSLSYKPKLDLASMDDLIRQVRQDCVLTSSADPAGFTIEFSDEDRYTALEMARALLVRMSDDMTKLSHTGNLLRIVEPLHVGETGPSRGAFTGLGLGVGLLLAGLTWLGFHRQSG